MQCIQLTWDLQKRLFSVPARIQIVERNGNGYVTNTKSTNTIMYLDTGSNLTSITDDEIERMGINKETLTKKTVAGTGGFTEIHILQNVSLLFLDSQGNPLVLDLDEIGINSRELKKVRTKKNGVFKQTNTTVTAMFSLLGIDSVIKYRGKIELDMNKLEGRIIF